MAGSLLPRVCPYLCLQQATLDQVKPYCKKLIDTVGEDGGYIMSSSGSLDDAKPENMQAMVDFTREYGVY